MPLAEKQEAITVIDAVPALEPLDPCRRSWHFQPDVAESSRFLASTLILGVNLQSLI